MENPTTETVFTKLIAAHEKDLVDQERRIAELKSELDSFREIVRLTFYSAGFNLVSHGDRTSNQIDSHRNPIGDMRPRVPVDPPPAPRIPIPSAPVPVAAGDGAVSPRMPAQIQALNDRLHEDHEDG
jgi:hypothetical protein